MPIRERSFKVNFEQARLPWENRCGLQTPGAMINNTKLMDRQDQAPSGTILYFP